MIFNNPIRYAHVFVQCCNGLYHHCVDSAILCAHHGVTSWVYGVSNQWILDSYVVWRPLSDKASKLHVTGPLWEESTRGRWVPLAWDTSATIWHPKLRTMTRLHMINIHIKGWGGLSQLSMVVNIVSTQDGFQTNEYMSQHLGPLLLTWFNLNPGLEK